MSEILIESLDMSFPLQTEDCFIQSGPYVGHGDGYEISATATKIVPCDEICDPYTQDDCGQPPVIEEPTPPTTTIEQPSRPTRDELPFTGSEMAINGLMALALVGTGAAAVLAGRKREKQYESQNNQ